MVILSHTHSKSNGQQNTAGKSIEQSATTGALSALTHFTDNWTGNATAGQYSTRVVNKKTVIVQLQLTKIAPRLYIVTYFSHTDPYSKTNTVTLLTWERKWKLDREKKQWNRSLKRCWQKQVIKHNTTDRTAELRSHSHRESVRYRLNTGVIPRSIWFILDKICRHLPFLRLCRV